MVLKVVFDKKIEQRFRELAMKKYGYTKGALTYAATEAITEWISKEGVSVPKVNDPVALMDGILSHLRGKVSSVELQHEAKKLWLK